MKIKLWSDRTLQNSLTRNETNTSRPSKQLRMRWRWIMNGQLLFVSRRGPTGTAPLQNVSTYDMFVTMHTLAAREKDIIRRACTDFLDSTSIDFAHNGSAFLTWHRYYLLIVESELRQVADRMGITDFTLPYWDWEMDNTTIFHSDFLAHLSTAKGGRMFLGHSLTTTGQLSVTCIIVNTTGRVVTSCEDCVT